MITTIPDAYGYVLMVASLLGLELLMIGFIFPGSKRAKVFSKAFMDKNFLEEHREWTGEADIPKGGAPDMGSGRYAAKLNYKEWYEFNNAQRAHYNFLEMAPSTFLWLLIAGIYFPVASAWLGLGVAVCRIIYSIGYASKGPKGRGLGAIGNDIFILGLFLLSMSSGYKFAQGDLP